MKISVANVNLQDFYGFIATNLLEKAQSQPIDQQDELRTTIMSAFLHRSNRKESLLQKLDKKHHWIAEAIDESQKSWALAHDGVLPMNLLDGEYAANLVNLENALTGNKPEHFSSSGELLNR